MISAVGKHSTKLSLMLNSYTDRPISTNHPLEALIGSFFAGVLAHIEGSGWLIQAPFFKSSRLLQIRRKSFTRWWCEKLDKTHSCIFLLTKPRDEPLESTVHIQEEEHFICFSCMEAPHTLNFLCPKF